MQGSRFYGNIKDVMRPYSAKTLNLPLPYHPWLYIDLCRHEGHPYKISKGAPDGILDAVGGQRPLRTWCCGTAPLSKHTHKIHGIFLHEIHVKASGLLESAGGKLAVSTTLSIQAFKRWKSIGDWYSIKIGRITSRPKCTGCFYTSVLTRNGWQGSPINLRRFRGQRTPVRK